MRYLLLIACLAILSYEDLKYKEVSIPFLVGLIATSLISGCVFIEDILDILRGLIPGAALIIVSIATRGRIGIGDGIVLAGIGLSLGCARAFEIFLIGLASSVAVGMVLLLIKKKDCEMPFVPFLLIGTVICAII